MTTGILPRAASDAQDQYHLVHALPYATSLPDPRLGVEA